MKTKLAYVGRGGLNLIMVLVVVVGSRMRVSLRPGNHSATRPVFESLARGPLPHHLGLVAGPSVLVALYFAGARWIERRKPSELLGCAGLKEFVAGVALGLRNCRMRGYRFSQGNPAGRRNHRYSIYSINGGLK